MQHCRHLQLLPCEAPPLLRGHVRKRWRRRRIIPCLFSGGGRMKAEGYSRCMQSHTHRPTQISTIPTFTGPSAFPSYPASHSGLLLSCSHLLKPPDLREVRGQHRVAQDPRMPADPSRVFYGRCRSPDWTALLGSWINA